MTMAVLVVSGEYAGRVERQFWVITYNGVKRMTAYSTHHAGIWWCPEDGHTMTEGMSLFNTEGEALAAAVKDAKRDVAAAKDRLARYEDCMRKLSSYG